MSTKTVMIVTAACVATLVPVSPRAAQGAESTKCTRAYATIIGTPGDDVLEGTSDQDVILGLGGNDRITAGGETFSEYYYDRICGGPGDDVLIGYQDDNPDYAERSAVVVGGPGDDRLLGGIELKGGPGNDELRGEVGADELAGGPGNDIIDGGEPDDGAMWFVDTVVFEEGPVTVDLVRHTARGEGHDRVFGIENVTGTAASDVIRGDEDRNALDGREGADQLIGRGGRDILMPDGDLNSEGLPSRPDRLNGGAGFDELLLFGYSSVRVDLRVGTVKTEGRVTAHVQSTEVIEGTLKDDVLIGDEHANVLDGGEDGADLIIGGGGDDKLLGGEPYHGEPDVLRGGSGDDLLKGMKGDDVLAGGPGTDTASFNHVRTRHVEAHLEDGTATGDGDDRLISIENLIGTPGEDLLEGDAGPNVLMGMGGEDYTDTLNGLGGDDTLEGGRGPDVLDGGEGTDTVSYATSIFAVDLDLEAGSATTRHQFGVEATDVLFNFESAIGSSLGDTLNGTEFANVLIGLSGDDTIQAKAGDDTIDGDDGNDAADGGFGTDSCLDIETPVGCETTGSGVSL